METVKTCQVHPTNCLKPPPELKIPSQNFFPTACRIPIWPFVVVMEAEKNPASNRDIGALNEEMDAAGARLFAGGLGTGRQGEIVA